MNITERTVGDVVIVSLGGALGYEGADIFNEWQKHPLNLRTSKKVLLDFREVPYINRAGLGEIIRFFASLSKDGGVLKFLGLSQRVLELFSRTKLTSIFECFPAEKEEEAIQSFSS